MFTRFSLFVFLCVFTTFVQAQKKTGIKGSLTDAVTGEGLVGATVTVSAGKAAMADLDGNYFLNLEDGEYTVTFSYVGYNSVEKKAIIAGNVIVISVAMETKMLKEIEVVADIAIARKTPVAFSNITPQKIQEQLGTQDLPMILNSTPGVYATQRGGGDGDARVSIRGFNSQNVMVLLDGIPMNDMHNGRVFWSNWFGLDNQTKTMQVQRGLGASKLALPAIGGTVNILTSGVETGRKVIFKQEFGNNNNVRTTLNFNSGRLKGDWAINSAVSLATNDGWVDQLYSKRFFYYLKVEKKLGKHNLSFSGFGGPQVSGQRDFRINTPVNVYDQNEAYELGVDTVGKTKQSFDRRYNPSWGYLRRTEGKNKNKMMRFNTNLNQYHKPVLSLRDFWTVNDKFYITNIAYASFGSGGGTQLNQSYNATVPGTRGELDIQTLYNNNRKVPLGSPWPSNPEQRGAANFLRKNYNEHVWYGTLSTFSYSPSNRLEFTGGFDARFYQGRVFSRVDDLLGGDFAPVGGDANEPQFTPKYQGDLIFQNVRRNIGWLGSFAMAEYKGGWYTAFLNVSASYSGYQQTNFFLKKTIELSDTTLNIGYNDTTTYGGVFYDRNHPDLKHNTTPIKYLLGYVVKGGMNFNVTESQNVFFNVGYFSRAPQMQFVYNNANVEWKGIKNEEIRSAEIGYNFKSPFFSYNFNSYYTIWNNRPTTVSVTTNSGESVPAFATGMSAVHKGVEMDFIVKPVSNFSFEGMVSLGDWKWATPATAIIFDNDGNEIGQSKFDPSGVRVGDAAQFTYGASLRYEPFKMFYIKPQFNFFSRNYANFSPEALEIDNLENNFGPNVGRQSWRMPDYGLLDLNLGYGFFNNNKKYDIRFSCINILDTFFISDANDNALLGQSFSAASASVNVGMGRRWVFSVTATF